MTHPGHFQFFPASGGLVGRTPFPDPADVLARDKFTDVQDQRGIARSRAVTGAGLRGDLMRKIAETIKSGGNLGTLLSDPSLIDAISSPDFDPQSIVELFTEAKKEADKVTPLAAGTAAFQGGEIVATNPPTKVQEAEGLAKLALQGNEFAAAVDAVNDMKAPEQKLKAIRDLERAGKLGKPGSPEAQALMNDLIAGNIKVGEFRDAAGNVVAKTLINIRSGSSSAVGSEVVQPTVTQGDPTQQPDGLAPGTTESRADPRAESSRQALSQLKDPTDALMAVGVVEATKRGVGGVVGQQFPDFSGTEAKARALATKNIRFAATNLRKTLGTRVSGTSREQMKIIDDIIPTISALRNPQQNMVAGINLFDLASSMKRNAEAVLADGTRTGKVRGKAASDIVAAEQVLAALPTRDQMQKRLDDLEAGIGAPPTITEAGTQAVKDGITLTKKLTGQEPSVSVREIRSMSLDQLLDLDKQRATAEQTFSKEQKAAMGSPEGNCR